MKKIFLLTLIFLFGCATEKPLIEGCDFSNPQYPTPPFQCINNPSFHDNVMEVAFQNYGGMPFTILRVINQHCYGKHMISINENPFEEINNNWENSTAVISNLEKYIIKLTDCSHSPEERWINSTISVEYVDRTTREQKMIMGKLMSRV